MATSNSKAPVIKRVRGKNFSEEGKAAALAFVRANREKMTAEDMAAKLGIHQSTIYYWLSAEKRKNKRTKAAAGRSQANGHSAIDQQWRQYAGSLEARAVTVLRGIEGMLLLGVPDKSPEQFIQHVKVMVIKAVTGKSR